MMCRGMRSEIPATLLTSQSPLKVDATCIDTNSEFHQNGYILRATAERTAAIVQTVFVHDVRTFGDKFPLLARSLAGCGVKEQCATRDKILVQASFEGTDARRKLIEK